MGLFPGLDKIGDFFKKPKLSYKYSQDLMTAGKGNRDALMGYGGSTSNQAYANLLAMLQSGGKTDPRLMNRTLSGIQRNTQGNQMALQGRLQGQGFQNSGVGAALMAALGQGGTGQQAGVVAQDASDQEQRRRADLELFSRLVGNPSLDYTSLGLGQYNATKQREMDITKMKMDIWGQLLKGVSGGVAG